MSEWITSKLSELAVFEKGRKVETAPAPRVGWLPYLGASAIEGKAAAFANPENGVIATENDLLMLWDGERSGLIGRADRGVVGSTVARISSRGVDSGFLYYSLQRSYPWIQARRTGTGIPHVPSNLGDWLELLHPESLKEQHLISHILFSLDTQIQKTQALIAKLERVKEGLLHDLLTRGIDENGQLHPSPEQAPELYKESPLGLIPKEWKVRPLKSHASSEITYGIVQAGPHVEGGVPYIRTGDMSGNRLERKGLLCTSRQVADQYKRSEVMGGDLVISIRATVGKVLPVPERLSGANLTQGTAKISPSSDVDRNYLMWAIRSEAVKNAIDLEVKGSTFKEITLAALREIPVAAPANLTEQRKIGESLAGIDGVIRRESDALMKLKAHKVGLMDDLLTGRVRVTPLLEQAQATTPA